MLLMATESQLLEKRLNILINMEEYKQTEVKQAEDKEDR